MAEFQEVMRQLNRMCSHFKSCEDNGCPLFNECGNIGIHSSNAKQAMRIEKTVTKWAAEHPESVYPTWGKVVEDITGIMMIDVIDDPIPANIAEKLGIQPKEGT